MKQERETASGDVDPDSVIPTYYMEIPNVPFGNPESQNGLGVERELKAHLVHTPLPWDLPLN